MCLDPPRQTFGSDDSPLQPTIKLKKESLWRPFPLSLPCLMVELRGMAALPWLFAAPGVGCNILKIHVPSGHPVLQASDFLPLITFLSGHQRYTHPQRLPDVVLGGPPVPSFLILQEILGSLELASCIHLLR